MAARDTIHDVRVLAIELRKDTYVSAQGHYCVANRWAGYHLYFGLGSTILSVFAGTSLLSGTEELEMIAGFIALTVSAITAISTFLNPNQHSLNHYTAGTNYIVVPNHARSFYQISSALRQKPDEEIIKEFYDLAAQRDELNKNSPRIPEWALSKARANTKFDLSDELEMWETSLR